MVSNIRKIAFVVFIFGITLFAPVSPSLALTEDPPPFIVYTLTHASSETSSLSVVATYNFSKSGQKSARLPNYSKNIAVRSGNLRLEYEVYPDTFDWKTIYFDLPPGQTTAEITYDAPAGVIAYEGKWNFNFSLGIDNYGPATVIIRLPPDATVEAYGSPEIATWVDEHTLRYDKADGLSLGWLYLVYRTNDVPKGSYTVTSDHFSVQLPTGYADYEHKLMPLLERFYSRMMEITGVDLAVQINHLFQFTFIPYNGSGRSGGSCYRPYGSHCMITAFWIEYLPFEELLFAHEMSHGWDFLYMMSPPWWFYEVEWFANTYSQFISSDSGICEQITHLYAIIRTNYLEYLQNPSLQTGLGIVPYVIHRTLIDEYGYDWLHQLHQDILDGDLDLDDLNETEKTDHLILYLSEVVGEDLTPFFDYNWISASQWVRDSLSDLPPAQLEFPETWECPPSQLSAKPSPLTMVLPLGSHTPVNTALIVFNETGYAKWEAKESIDEPWLSINSWIWGESFPLFPAAIKVRFDPTGLAEGVYNAEIIVTVLEGGESDPMVVPVRLQILPMDNTYLPLIFSP